MKTKKYKKSKKYKKNYWTLKSMIKRITQEFDRFPVDTALDILEMTKEKIMKSPLSLR